MEPVFAHLCASPPRSQCRPRRDAPLAPHRRGTFIYTTPRFYKENRLTGFKGYEYWLRTTAKTPREAYPGQSWRFWQSSATGLIDGILGEVDLNASNGSNAEWNAWRAARAHP